MLFSFDEYPVIRSQPNILRVATSDTDRKLRLPVSCIVDGSVSDIKLTDFELLRLTLNPLFSSFIPFFKAQFQLVYSK